MIRMVMKLQWSNRSATSYCTVRWTVSSIFKSHLSRYTTCIYISRNGNRQSNGNQTCSISLTHNSLYIWQISMYVKCQKWNCLHFSERLHIVWCSSKSRADTMTCYTSVSLGLQCDRLVIVIMGWVKFSWIG